MSGAADPISSRMKIAYLCFGHVDVTLPLIKHLRQSVQVDLILVFARTRKSESVIDFSDVDVPKGFLPRELIARAIDARIPRYLGDGGNMQLFVYKSLKTYAPGNIRLSLRLARYLRTQGYDCIHFSGNDLAQSWISMATPGVPKVHTIHDWKSHSGERNRLAEWYNHRLVASGSHVIFHAREGLPSVNPADNLHMVHYGPLEIYREWLDRPVAETASGILFFGRVSPYKGLKYLLRALPMIKSSVPGICLTIAGEGDFQPDEVECMADDSVTVIHRRLDNAELAGLIQAAAVVVCPYTDATQSGVIMTAFAFGKPVVATRVGGIPEVVREGQTGVLVPPRDPKALARAITELLLDESKRRRMESAIQGIAREGTFAWDHIADETIAIYEKACGKAAGLAGQEIDR